VRTKEIIAVDTDSWTTGMQRSSQTVRSAECEQLEMFVMTSESYLIIFFLSKSTSDVLEGSFLVVCANSSKV
jgi:hypothetical protein